MNQQYRILITGASGQLGCEFRQLEKSFSDYSFFYADRAELDITNSTELKNYLETNSINILINCAAYTAVDKAEEEIELSQKINALAPRDISLVCNQLGVHFIHYSTDYVFDGTSEVPYKEDDRKRPISQYGKSKSQGEDFIVENSQSYTIIRTAWVYSSFGQNFLKTMIRLGNQKSELSIVDDQLGSPTYAADLAQITLDILPQLVGRKEILHISNEGRVSWAGFAREIFKKLKIECSVKPITTEEFGARAPRPQYSLLDKSRLKNVFKRDIDNWDDALGRCMEKLGDS